MTAGEPRVVGDVVVAWPHPGERIDVEEMLDRVGHGIDVAGRAGHRLREHAALGIEHAGREVARLAHRGAESGAHQGLRLLLDHRDQAAPHDLGVNLGERGIRAGDHVASLSGGVSEFNVTGVSRAQRSTKWCAADPGTIKCGPRISGAPFRFASRGAASGARYSRRLSSIYP